MKTIKWLHLSDIHLNKQGVENRRIRDQLLKYLCENKIQCDYIFFTGDLRFAPEGDFSPYTVEYLEDICDCVNVSKDHFFIVPGNHDIDLKDPLCLKAKNNIIRYYDIHEGIIKQKDLEYIYRGKEDYISILERFYDKDSPVLRLSKDVLHPHFVIETEDFNILHVDSTLICSKERNRDLYLGTDLLLDACKKLNQDKPTVLLTHYSFDSMDRNEQIVILKLLQEYNIQLWLAGHEHRDLARMQRDFFYEFQCGNLLYEDDQTRACVYVGEYNPETYLGSLQLYYWLSPDDWTLYPFLKDHSTIYEFELQDNTSQIIKMQSVINSRQEMEEGAFSNSYDQISISQELKDSVLCKNLYQTGESKLKGVAFDENVWKGFLYLDGSYSPLLELEIHYIRNRDSSEIFITSDSLEFEIKREVNNKDAIIKIEVSVNYNLSVYTDVSIRLKQFEDIRQYLSADVAHIRIINHEEYNIDFKIRCIGDEKWNELNITTNYWYELMKDIAKIEHYYNINFVLPQKMLEDDYKAIGTITDSIDCRSCRNLPGIPDEHPGLKKTMVLESDTWLNNGAELPKLTLFGYTFKPTAQFLMKGEFVWDDQKNMWQSDTDKGIPIRVEFDLDEREKEIGLMREYPFSKGIEELVGFQLCVLRDPEVSYLRYYAKLGGEFKQLQQLYSVYRKQLNNFIVFDVENSHQYKFISEDTQKVITRVTVNELLNSVVSAGKKLIDGINDFARSSNFQHDQRYKNFSDEWTDFNGGYLFLMAMKIYMDTGYFPLSLTDEGIGYFDFQEIRCTAKNNCESYVNEIMIMTKDLLTDSGFDIDIVDAYPMIRNYIYIIETVYLKYLLAVQPMIKKAYEQEKEILVAHANLVVSTGVFKDNIVFIDDLNNKICAFIRDDNLLIDFYEHKEAVISDLKESRQGLKNDPIEWE